MATFKEQVYSLSGIPDEDVITSYNLTSWTKQGYSEIFPIVPKSFYNTLIKKVDITKGEASPSDLQGLNSNVGEFNKIVAVYCLLGKTYESKLSAFKEWQKIYGDNDFGSKGIPSIVKAREIAPEEYIEANSSSDTYIDSTYGENRHYSLGTPLDPVWTREEGFVKAAPYKFHFRVAYIDTPVFDVDKNLSESISGFDLLPSEIRNIMAIYVARMVKLYELDNCNPPEFETDINISENDFLNSNDYSLVEGLNTIVNEVKNTSEDLYLDDEDVELASTSIKTKSTKLEALKSKAGVADSNLKGKIAVLQQDIMVFDKKLSRYTQKYSKMNKDLEQLGLKYNEAIASINGQPFTGKASKNELDRVKQDIASLKQAVGRRG
tara:strand:+ start:960 stop:2096 length:1137 start_codon:yes stop_codon:yes gene_type:complete